MLVNRNRYGFTSNKKHVIGTGFVDSLSSIINSIKASAAPALHQYSKALATMLRIIKISSQNQY